MTILNIKSNGKGVGVYQMNMYESMKNLINLTWIFLENSINLLHTWLLYLDDILESLNSLEIPC